MLKFYSNSFVNLLSAGIQLCVTSGCAWGLCVKAGSLCLPASCSLSLSSTYLLTYLLTF